VNDDMPNEAPETKPTDPVGQPCPYRVDPLERLAKHRFIFATGIPRAPAVAGGGGSVMMVYNCESCLVPAVRMLPLP
jgi:hypothetical protein